MTPGSVFLATLALCLACHHVASAEEGSVSRADNHRAESSRDGVYGRFDGDLDLGLAMGAELGTAGTAAPAVRGSAHYFSLAGLYAGGRFKAGAASAPSLFELGLDVRPLFIPRWAKGYETGPARLDLTLDSLSLSLGAFWAEQSQKIPKERGFEASLGFGVPLLASAVGPWLEARGVLRYPDSGPRGEALLVAFSWHAFVITPLVSSRDE